VKFGTTGIRLFLEWMRRFSGGFYGGTKEDLVLGHGKGKIG